ncbi:hypothetical protein QUA82_21560 [Microcoleus sp. F8-D3]
MQLPALAVISCSHATKVRSPIVCWGDRKDAIAMKHDSKIV